MKGTYLTPSRPRHSRPLQLRCRVERDWRPGSVETTQSAYWTAILHRKYSLSYALLHYFSASVGIWTFGVTFFYVLEIQV